MSPAGRLKQDDNKLTRSEKNKNTKKQNNIHARVPSLFAGEVSGSDCAGQKQREMLCSGLARTCVCLMCPDLLTRQPEATPTWLLWDMFFTLVTSFISMQTLSPPPNNSLRLHFGMGESYDLITVVDDCFSFQ